MILRSRVAISPFGGNVIPLLKRHCVRLLTNASNNAILPPDAPSAPSYARMKQCCICLQRKRSRFLWRMDDGAQYVCFSCVRTQCGRPKMQMFVFSLPGTHCSFCFRDESGNAVVVDLENAVKLCGCNLCEGSPLYA